MTLPTELKNKTANHLRRMATAMASMLLLSILATNRSGGTNDGVLNFNKTPLLLQQPTIITFDGPGAGTGPGQGTIAFAINPAGTISGRYADSAGAIHAILRFAGGSIISFDAPGAGIGNRQGTRPFSINPAGATARYYTDPANRLPGSLPLPNVVIIPFEVPGAAPGLGKVIFAGNINASVAIADVT